MQDCILVEGADDKDVARNGHILVPRTGWRNQRLPLASAAAGKFVREGRQGGGGGEEGGRKEGGEKERTIRRKRGDTEKTEEVVIMARIWRKYN